MMRRLDRARASASTTAAGSPRMSVMSLASMAMSVPVPMAIPTSACASGPATPARTRRVTSKPSMSGICQSISTRSKPRRPRMSKACAPSLAAVQA